MASKNKEDPAGAEGAAEEGSPSKRPKLGEGSSRSSAAGVSSESDEEFTLGSDDSEQEEYSDSAEDSSDIEEEEEEEGEEGEATDIITGVQVELRELEDGKYGIFNIQKGRELKILLPEKAKESAKSSSKDLHLKKLIPVFMATEIEITKDDEVELIAYANNLTLVKDEFAFSSKEEKKDSEKKDNGEAFEENSWCIIRVESVTGEFATSDLLE